MIWRALSRFFYVPSVQSIEHRPLGKPVPDAFVPYQPVSKLTDDDARTALTQAGLSHGRDADIAFVRRAIGGNSFAKGIDLRRCGEPAPIETLRELKVRANAVLTVEYLAILTAKGLADPIETAQFLVSAYQSRLAGTNAIGRAAHTGIKRVAVIPNTMAAGPCAACMMLSRHPIPAADAPTGPLPECPHPTQCQLRTRAVLEFE
jgi:hypothetical protein